MTRTIPGIGDSGLFYFFDDENLEFLIKVLDGCGLNDHFWVFFAATTNVEFTLIVTDSVTGTRKTYFNPLGTSANTVNDTSAFPTCDASTATTPGAKAYVAQKRAAEIERVKVAESARLEARLSQLQSQGRDLLGDASTRLTDVASPRNRYGALHPVDDRPLPARQPLRGHGDLPRLPEQHGRR